MRMNLLSGRLSALATPALLMGVVAVSAVVTGWLAAPEIDYAVVTALVLLVVVIGLYVFTGNSGVFSFGHIALMAIGGYTAALLSVPAGRKEILFPEMPGFLAHASVAPLPAVLIGGLVAAITAGLFAVPLMRLAGLTAALGTFALLFIVYDVASNWDAVTNGGAGIGGIPRVTTQGSALVWALVFIALAWWFQHSRVGLRLRASREDERAAEASGVNVARERGIAFVLSAFVVGVGGGLYAQHIGTITPEAFYLPLTFLTLAMLVIGGINALSGAVIGVVVVTALQQALVQLEARVDRPGITEVGLSLAMLAMLLARPRGLTAGREIGLGSLRNALRRGVETPEPDASHPRDRGPERDVRTKAHGSSRA
jgi:branched-chain amino acid transport system permease protein